MHRVCLIVGVASFATSASADVIRVPQDQPTIQAGIDAAEPGDTVIVADGVWTGEGNRGIEPGPIDVVSKNGPGSCIIDCEGADRGFRFPEGASSEARVSGFTIINGYHQFRGGGIFIGETNSPVIEDCVIRNCASGTGGGIQAFLAGNHGPFVTIRNCVIRGNRATGNISGGGGINSYNGQIVVENCLIVGNMAPIGAGITDQRTSWSVALIRSCTIMGNDSGDRDGGFVRLGIGGGSIRNSIVRGNSGAQVSSDETTVAFSNIEGGWPGEGNIDKNPRFVGGPLGEFYLSSKKTGHTRNSPCINAGDGTAGELGLRKFTTRTDGKRDNKAVDMGYHYPRP